MLSANHLKLIELDRQKEQIKKFYEEYSNTLNALVAECGIGHMFMDDQGIVYKLTQPDGKWVPYEKYSVNRTKRPGEERGSLSIKEAQAAGFSCK